MTSCGWSKAGCHVNRVLVFEVLERSGRVTVRIILEHFLPLTVLFLRQRCQVGITLALEQSTHVDLRRRCEQYHLHPVRQCPDVYDLGTDIWTTDNIV